MKYILRASMAMVALLFLSCVNTEDPTQGATVRLKLTGGIAVNQPADDATRAVSGSEQLTVNSMRVLIFNNSALVSNTLFTSGFTVDGSGDNWIVSMGADAYVDARYGENDVYVVLNENAGGLTEQLNAVQTKTQMETLRAGKVEYTELIAVDNNNEPGFLMCVYDKVDINSTKTTLDMTGLGSSTYGFPMRRTMAKVVLEAIYGGVDTDNKILGTDITYDPTSATDQTGTGDKVTLDKNGNTVGTTGNLALANTSEVFVSKVELINVPKEYNWVQMKDDSQNNVESSTSNFLPAQNISEAYVLPENPIPSQNYMQRVWKGSIIASGKVGFSRIDSFPIFYKQEANKGGNSYDIKEAYPFGSEPDPKSDDAEFNSGNFIPWVSNLYSGEQIIEGIVTPKLETLDLISELNPAAWSVATVDGKNKYYIPENIQSNTTNKTMLRVYLSIGTVMVDIDEEEIQKIIDKGLQDEEIPVIKEDGTQITITGKDVSYVIEQAKAIQNPTTIGDGLGSNGQAIAQDLAWGICYSGINAIWSGSYDGITNQEGYYFVDVTSKVSNYYVDIPLAPENNNIYRGHEYKVKLYITRNNSNANWTPVAEANRSVTYHELPAMTTRGGESDLCIAAEVIATPVE